MYRLCTHIHTATCRMTLKLKGMAQRVIKLRQIACQNSALSLSARVSASPSLCQSLCFSLLLAFSLFLAPAPTVCLRALLLQKQLSSALFALFIFAASTNKANCHNRPRLQLVHAPPPQLASLLILPRLHPFLNPLTHSETCMICIVK